MDVVQMLVTFSSRLKGHGYKRIHTKLVATYYRDAYAIDSVKRWVREYDGGRRDPPGFSKADRPPFDIAEAVSQVLNEQPFSSTKYIAAQLRLSRELVKRIDAMGMRKVSLCCVAHTVIAVQKAQRVADSRGLLMVLRANATNRFVNIMIADES
jgi:hypothetical protein